MYASRRDREHRATLTFTVQKDSTMLVQTLMTILPMHTDWTAAHVYCVNLIVLQVGYLVVSIVHAMPCHMPQENQTNYADPADQRHQQAELQ